MGVGSVTRPLVIGSAGTFGYFGCLDLEIHVPYHGLSVSAHSNLALGTVNFDVKTRYSFDPVGVMAQSYGAVYALDIGLFFGVFAVGRELVCALGLIGGIGASWAYVYVDVWEFVIGANVCGGSALVNLVDQRKCTGDRWGFVVVV